MSRVRISRLFIATENVFVSFLPPGPLISKQGDQKSGHRSVNFLWGQTWHRFLKLHSELCNVFFFLSFSHFFKEKKWLPAVNLLGLFIPNRAFILVKTEKINKKISDITAGEPIRNLSRFTFFFIFYKIIKLKFIYSVSQHRLCVCNVCLYVCVCRGSYQSEN